MSISQGLLDHKESARLNGAIIAYLKENGLQKVAAQLESSLEGDSVPVATGTRLLEKKWLATTQLQMKLFKTRAEATKLKSKLHIFRSLSRGVAVKETYTPHQPCSTLPSCLSCSTQVPLIAYVEEATPHRLKFQDQNNPSNSAPYQDLDIGMPVSCVSFCKDGITLCVGVEGSLLVYGADIHESCFNLKDRVKLADSSESVRSIIAYTPAAESVDIWACVVRTTGVFQIVEQGKPGKTLSSNHLMNTNGAAIASNQYEDWLVLGFQDGRVSRWSLTDNDMALPKGHEAGGGKSIDSIVGLPCFARDASACSYATGGRDNIIRIWLHSNSSTTCLQQLTWHSTWIRILVLQNDGALVTSASDDGRVLTWNIANGAIEEERPRAPGVTEIHFGEASHSYWIVTAGRKKFIRWSKQAHHLPMLTTPQPPARLNADTPLSGGSSISNVFKPTPHIEERKPSIEKPFVYKQLVTTGTGSSQDQTDNQPAFPSDSPNVDLSHHKVPALTQRSDQSSTARRVRNSIGRTEPIRTHHPGAELGGFARPLKAKVNNHVPPPIGDGRPTEPTRLEFRGSFGEHDTSLHTDLNKERVERKLTPERLRPAATERSKNTKGMIDVEASLMAHTDPNKERSTGELSKFSSGEKIRASTARNIDSSAVTERSKNTRSLLETQPKLSAQKERSTGESPKLTSSERMRGLPARTVESAVTERSKNPLGMAEMDPKISTLTEPRKERLAGEASKLTSSERMRTSIGRNVEPSAVTERGKNTRGMMEYEPKPFMHTDPRKERSAGDLSKAASGERIRASTARNLESPAAAERSSKAAMGMLETESKLSAAKRRSSLVALTSPPENRFIEDSNRYVERERERHRRSPPPPRP